MDFDDSLISQACQIHLDAALSARLPRVELTLLLYLQLELNRRCSIVY